MIALPVVDRERRPNTTTIRDLDWYDYCLVSFSGGKDSIALALSLLKRGVAKERIVLMHQQVDGQPGVDEPFMDWPCTESYCRAFSQATGMRLLFQWRHGGFHRELLKENARTSPVSFEYLDGGVGTAGGVRGKVGTRRLFPQVTADLSKRWCSPSLKIDVASIAINNEPAFRGKRLLFLRRGVIRRWKGEFDKAVEDFEAAIGIDPEHAEAHYWLAKTFWDQEMYQDCIYHYDEAIRLDPPDAEGIQLDWYNSHAYFERAEAYRSLSKYRLAIKDYNEAIRLHSQVAEAFYGRGMSYYHESRFPLAVADLREAVQLDPSNMDYCGSLDDAEAAAAAFPEGGS